jgi:hypothetical protein
MDTKNKMPNSKDTKNQEQPRNEEQEQYAALIERLSVDTLKDLQAGNTNVDIAGLMQAIEAYSKFPNYYKPAVERWKARLAEITQVLEAQYKKVQEEIKNMTDNNPKLNTYNKTTNIEE